MFIYKITNKITNKVYIGQVYNKSIYDRFNRHIKEASASSHSYIDRSINKYGAENFIVTQIDTANSLDELNEKEIYWIKYYNSTDKSKGYNLTNDGDGGNTYLCKSEDELNKIKSKISKANTGSNNGMAKQLKAYNYNTKEIIHFETFHEACKYFNIINKGIFALRCENKVNSLYKNEWTFAYEYNDFNYNLSIYDPSTKRGTKIKIINLKDNSVNIVNSINKANEFLNCKSKKLDLATVMKKHINIIN